ncbi:MAG: hypothetical protein QXG03_10680 [Halalkalicoccus sp.]
MSDEGSDTITYRGEIDEEEWEEFKRYVPRTVKLGDKLNELIRDWTQEQKEREKRLQELEDEHGTED